jgi:hypothetical protein
MRLQGRINEHGSVFLTQIPPGLKTGTPVWVELPDYALPRSPSNAETTGQETVLSETAQKILDHLREVRTQSLRKTSEMELTEKQRQRWEAFEFRARVREEQGRPA